jgi:hypothetical protein
MYTVPTECPVCHDDLLVERLACRNCGTVLENRFEMDRLSRLIPEQRHFVEVFLRCEGKLNCLQEELGISYPTARNRLEEVIQALGYEVNNAYPPPPEPEEVEVEEVEEVEETVVIDRDDILERLARKEISSEEALALLEGR